MRGKTLAQACQSFLLVGIDWFHPCFDWFHLRYDWFHPRYDQFRLLQIVRTGSMVPGRGLVCAQACISMRVLYVGCLVMCH